MSKFERWIKNIAQAGIVVITLEKLFDFIAYHIHFNLTEGYLKFVLTLAISGLLWLVELMWEEVSK